MVLLKQPDGGDARSTGFEAGERILQGDSAKGQNWYVFSARSAEGFKARRSRFERVFLFEDGSEEGEGGLVGGGLVDFFRRVAGDGDEWIS